MSEQKLDGVPTAEDPARGASGAAAGPLNQGCGRLRPVLLSKVLLSLRHLLLAARSFCSILVLKTSGWEGGRCIVPIVSASPSSFFHMGNWHFLSFK